RDRLCGLSVVDLDDFKSVNDTLGHPVGDGLIYAVAERLAAVAGQGITVSRFGGDEFMIFFDRIEDESHLTGLLDQIFADLQGEVDVAGHGLRIQASAGAVLSKVADTDVDAMIVKADLA
ncbi:GGDEF domain-containing protein, partial [Mesorhizobium sp. M2D.F.Ca.ET.178.01.1.1]